MTGVAFTGEYHLSLAAQLPAERTADRPSRQDFENYDQAAIEQNLPEVWSSLLPSPTNPYYRSLIAEGLVVPAYVVRAFLRPDGDIEVQDITIDWDFQREAMPDETD